MREGLSQPHSSDVFGAELALVATRRALHAVASTGLAEPVRDVRLVVAPATHLS
jgi:hypothetical protein